MITRQIEQNLTNWWQNPRRRPLILRGARQVGKTYLVEKWAHENKKNLIKINLETDELRSFNLDVLQIQRVIDELELKIDRKLDPQNDLIFFDEIQKKPKCIVSLRYFYEQRPDLAVISAGSLLDFVLGEEEFSFPVGRVEFLYLGPVIFSDFLKAIGKNLLAQKLKSSYVQITPEIHHQLKETYRLYLVIGGMPAAIQTYIDTKDFLQVRKVHQLIADAYMADFAKYSKGRSIDFCETLFRFIPGHLGQKIKYTEIDRNAKARDLNKSIDLLIKARVILKVVHTNATRIPLAAFMDESLFKLFFLDVGLCATLQGERVENLLYGDSILTGQLSEQFVVQHLNQLDPTQDSILFYWLREKSKHKAELDFIYQLEDQILPIEVKAEAGGTLRSLHAFMSEHPQIHRGFKISSQEYSIQKIALINQTGSSRIGHFELINIPLWFVESIKDLFLPKN